MFLSSKNKKAFTLIELSVSIFIIVVMISFVFINFNTGAVGVDLINTQTSLFQNIKLAQNYALSYRSYDGGAPKYWGLYIDPNGSRFVLFADINENAVYDEGEAESLFGGKVLSLPVGVEFSYLAFNTSAISILFELGSGRMSIYDIDTEDFDNNPWLIELKDKQFDFSRLILINPPTEVDVQDCSCSDSSLYCCSFCSPGGCVDFEVGF